MFVVLNSICFSQEKLSKREIIKKKINQTIPIALKETNVDCWLTITREAVDDPIAEDLGGSGAVARAAFIFCLKDNKFEKVAIAASYDITPIKESGIYDEIILYKHEGIKPHLIDIFKKLSPDKIALNFSRDQPIADGLTKGMYNYLVEILGKEYEKKFVSSEDIIIQYRSVKLPEELEYIKKAVVITQNVLEYCLSSKSIMPGVTTEEDLTKAISDKTREKGADMAFCLVNVGVSRGHSSSTQRIIQKGDLIRVDYGVDYNGYKSDIQRTAYVLKNGEDKPPAKIQKMWEVVFKSNHACVEKMKPGVIAITCDEAARKIIVDAGYPEYPYAAGHPIGFDVHDIGVIIGPDWKERYGSKMFKKFQVGQTFAVEPTTNIYDVNEKGDIGIGLEEDVIIEKDGAKYIGTPQTEIYLIK
jgi:Xaa-Pro aminopeptidase